MEDLGLVATLLLTSSTLERAAGSVKKMADDREKINSAEKEALKWAGEFLLAMDWNAHQDTTNKVAGGLAIQATSVRPTFYSCLFRMAPQIRDAGMKDERELISFLGSLYRNLQSPDSLGRGYKKLTSEQAKLGALLLHEMAESILVQINNNGLPRQTATLNDEWEPSAN